MPPCKERSGLVMGANIAEAVAFPATGYDARREITYTEQLICRLDNLA